MKIFNFLIDDPYFWNITKIVFIISSIFSAFIIFYFVYSLLCSKRKRDTNKQEVPTFGLLIGLDKDKNKVYISEKGLRWLKISDATAVDAPFILEIKEHIKEITSLIEKNLK